MQMRFMAAAFTALGGRETNQDSAHADPRLLVVADGVGGAPAGEVASAVAVRAVVEAGPDTDPALLAERANSAVVAHAEADPATAGMATTVDIAALVPGPAGWEVRGAHVGDSFTLVQTDRVTRLGRAHTLAEELVAGGHITPEEGARHPNRSALMRAVGMGPTVEPELWSHPAAPGTRYLLSSDGLFDALGMEAVVTLLDSLRPSPPADVARMLVESACAAGARDNVTVVVAEVTPWQG
ncbi:PP2C family protein-serine/threonine phosphatase [Actinokineospora spheciospongiae]|uniref:PP2C family protein-serine/threonine phosphatase n=1 Tax=Actinokineospora spheciospongiae TaxID=909613 RepID=UPI000D7161A1|nr:PP2C family serine/threonine-protein phosphatase [Actinokineospora spheciospongiae]PWW56206.1 protein phosphatase [Actinokineospora spheciospongiae]